MRVRLYKSCDAAALAAIFHASARIGGLKQYSAEQVAAWSPAPPEVGSYEHRADEHVLFVAVDAEDQPIGYADLRPDGHIEHLYCRPDRIGTGVGSALCAAVEAAAVSADLAVLTVDASEGARLLLERRGFQVEQRQDLRLNGVAIHNYHMVKVLAG